MGENMNNTDKLDIIIRQFFDKKNISDSNKKEAEKYNQEIKDLMNEFGINDYISSDGLQAKITVQNRESFKEPELIEKLIELKQNDIIELVPTINYAKLEDAIYNGKIDASMLSEFKETKEVITLKVSKKKGE